MFELGGAKLMVKRPVMAFVISLVAGVLVLVNGVFFAVAATALGGLFSGILYAAAALALRAILGGLLIVLEPFIEAVTAGFVVIGLIFGILVIVGSALMCSRSILRVKVGSSLVLVFSILSVLVGGGFFIGLILGVVGGALGLLWKPPAAAA